MALGKMTFRKSGRRPTLATSDDSKFGFVSDRNKRRLAKKDKKKGK